MGYFEEKKSELDSLVRLIASEKKEYLSAVESERTLLKEEAALLKAREEDLKRLEESVRMLAKERQRGFPLLAKAYDELFLLRENKVIESLKTKKNPSIKGAEKVKEISKLRREAERDKKIAQYLVEYYENIAPFLADLKDEVVDEVADESSRFGYSDDELEDSASNFLTVDEYRKLSTKEKNQLALDRYWKRPKSKLHIGRIYERYVGYVFENDGYDVSYEGIFKGFEDLGRDLICTKNKDVVIVQCKNWSAFKQIHEKHIFQFFGTVFKYKDENKEKNCYGAFYTSTNLSPLARRFANELGVQLMESFKMDNRYPCIKCNISREGTRIYHLPFDQQYDKTRITLDKGDFYCATVNEAEEAGFRRAFRYKPISK